MKLVPILIAALLSAVILSSCGTPRFYTAKVAAEYADIKMGCVGESRQARNFMWSQAAFRWADSTRYHDDIRLTIDYKKAAIAAGRKVR